MAAHVLLDPKILYGRADITGEHSSVRLRLSNKEAPADVFGNAAKTRLAGLPSWRLTHSGFWEAGTGTIDTDVLNGSGTTGKIVTVSGTGASLADIAYSSKVMEAKWDIGGKVGDSNGFNGEMVGDGTKIIRGTVLGSGAKTSTAAAASGSQLGAVSATQHVYGVLHVVAVAGDDTQSLVVKIQSDDNASFTSATDRITFSTVTSAVASEWATPIDGAITDDYWRAYWNIANGGEAVSFTIYVNVAIM